MSVWLYENVNTRIEGHIVGFDEFMNLVLDDAVEVHLKRRTKKEVRYFTLPICLLGSSHGPSSNNFVLRPLKPLFWAM